MAMRVRQADLEQLYTIEEFTKLAQFNERYELLDGKLVEKPMPKPLHGRVARRILVHYAAFDPTNKLGEFIPDSVIAIRDDYAPVPDLSYWIASRVPGDDVSIPNPPDLAVEIQSPGQSLVSLEAKTRDYLAAGTQLAWIIQSDKRSVNVYRPNQSVQTLIVGGELSVEDVIPGYILPVAALFG